EVRRVSETGHERAGDPAEQGPETHQGQHGQDARQHGAEGHAHVVHRRQHEVAPEVGHGRPLLNSSSLVAHSFTAPATSPRTRKRCRAMTITTGGRLASIDAAAMSPQGTSKTPGNSASATGIVRLASETVNA